MVLISSIEKLKEVLFRVKSNGKSVGLVPTMGALHEGHLSLLERAKAESQVVVATIFVNPIQFNNSDDLKNYPRTLDSDLNLIQDLADIVFAPSVDEIFPTPPSEKYDFGALESVMEGASRPGHFNGVATIVKRLFDYVNPDKAFFGEKDFQQLAIIKDLVKQSQLDITIVPCPIVREPNGLAMSSRNQRLTPTERDIAAKVYEILNHSLELAHTKPDLILNYVISEVNQIKDIRLEYFQIVDDTTLQNVDIFEEGKGVVGCIAFYIRDVRLIDNIRYH
ncbi:MAG: pantoate--beta-alanine ligase [Bacteroidales bacterium]|jgi:pantoate--beta-alanine ligase|nr:pantoate--beta-alanine ligase [Bacteroidales bacterium]